MTKLVPPLAPMEATSVTRIPPGREWQYEPKWDGFRCLAFRDGPSIYLQSKAEKPLARYFPEIVQSLGSLGARRFVLDGELVVPVNNRLDFDELLQRIHPAASRILKLSNEHPALYVVFDLLSDERGKVLVTRPLEERRAHLEAFAERYFPSDNRIRLCPATTRLSTVQRWYKAVGGNLDGVVAKVLACPYRSGERDGMVKIKPSRTADCVVGGFRYGTGSSLVGSLLLGLYDSEGLLHQSDSPRTSRIPNDKR